MIFEYEYYLALLNSMSKEKLYVFVILVIGILVFTIRLIYKLNDSAGVFSNKEKFSSKWAKQHEFKTRLKGNPFSIIIGHHKKSFLGLYSYYKPIFTDSVQHVLVFVRTRGGKGVSLITPTLLTYEGSIVITDPKKESYDLTHSYRKNILKQKIILFNPAEKGSKKFNLFDFVNWDNFNNSADDTSSDNSNKETEEQGLLEIGFTMVEDKSDGNDNSKFFSDQARLLFISISRALHYQYGDTSLIEIDPKKEQNLFDSFKIKRIEGLKNKHSKDGSIFSSQGKMRSMATLSKVYKILTRPQAQIAHYIQQTTDEELTEIGRGWSEMAVATFTSISGSAVNSMALYNDPIVAENTSQSDFSIENLLNEKTTLYLVVQPKDLERISPIIKLFYKRITTSLSVESSKNNTYNKLLLIMDEAYSLGKQKSIAVGSSYYLGYNIQLMVIYQNMKQLTSNYGKDAGAFLDNFVSMVFSGTEDSDTISIISKKCGDITHKPKKGGGGKPKRELISNSDVRKIPDMERKLDENGNTVAIKKPGEGILFVAGTNPIKTYMVPFWYYKTLAERVKVTD